MCIHHFWLRIFILGLAISSLSCANHSQKNEENCANLEKKDIDNDSITTDELCSPDPDTLHLWENGFFLGKKECSRDYKSLIVALCQQESLSARDIEAVYPESVEEMNWFYSQLKDTGSSLHAKICRMDTLMTFYAIVDSLYCLPRFLNMYFYMDPRVIDRDWMGEWNLERAMYTVIPGNRESFKSYYDTLNKKYEWLTREWVYAYQNF